MVKMVKTKIMRPAIAMLELIFAIVIMGIILMSAPSLISTASKSGFVAIQQEAINEAASQVNMIMGYHWDENDADESYIDPLLQVSSTTAGLVEAGTTGRRPGTPKESFRAFVRSDGQRLSASALGSDADDTEEDDIDDFGGETELIEIESAVADTVEKTTIKINKTISYSADTANYNQSSITFDPSFTNAGGTTNIKSIIVTLTSDSSAEELNQKEITLRAFSCNIGGYKLEEREF